MFDEINPQSNSEYRGSSVGKKRKARGPKGKELPRPPPLPRGIEMLPLRPALGLAPPGSSTRTGLAGSHRRPPALLLAGFAKTLGNHDVLRARRRWWARPREGPWWRRWRKRR